MGDWTHREHGIIGDNHEVTFSQGKGSKEGETLIADGFLSKREFNRAHNHYGPDTKYGDGSGRIEDKTGDRGHYTGPGR